MGFLLGTTSGFTSFVAHAGGPPLGSWMDILVFFWVELILMLSVAAVVTTILLRANDARHHPGETG